MKITIEGGEEPMRVIVAPKDGTPQQRHEVQPAETLEIECSASVNLHISPIVPSP